MRVHGYLLVLALVCGLGGLGLSGSIVWLQGGVDDASVALERSRALQHDTERLSDQLRQIFVSSDLVFGAGETYLLAPLKDQLQAARILERRIASRASEIGVALDGLTTLAGLLADLIGEVDAFEQQMYTQNPNATPDQLARVDQLGVQLVDTTGTLTTSVLHWERTLETDEQRARTRLRQWLLPLSAGYLVLVILTLLWCTYRLAGPISRLTAQARAAISDHRSFRPSLEGPQEVVELKAHLASLVLSLQSRIRETQAIVDAIPDTLLSVSQPRGVKLLKIDEHGLTANIETEGVAGIQKLLSSADRRRVSEALATCTASNTVQTLEVTLELGGERRIYELRLSPAQDKGAVLLARDLTEAKRAERKIRELAYQDSLTGLMNRTAFLTHAQQAIATQPTSPFGLLFIDLDRFKWVNDTKGHDAGDFVLTRVSDCIREVLRDSDRFTQLEFDSSARIGGDEFLVQLPGIADADILHRISQRLLDALLAPMSFQGQEFTIGASLGGALFPDHGDDVETLIKHADLAMYQAKRLGGNQLCVYSEQLGASSGERLALEDRLRRALASDELTLFYQPILDLESGSLKSLECLVRWQDGAVLRSPAEFIPVAEEAGLIQQLGEWVLAEALRQLGAWDRQGLGVSHIAINVSGLQFRQHRVERLVQAALADAGIDPTRLTLEVTESVLLSPEDAPTEQLEALRANGVQVALDDFGTGYSSLSHLHKLPVDALKIDRSFIAGMEQNQALQHIVETIIRLGEMLGLQVIAEGVESPAQLRLLKSFRCPCVQGYLFARPLPAEDLPTLLTDLQNHAGSAGSSTASTVEHPSPAPSARGNQAEQPYQTCLRKKVR